MKSNKRDLTHIEYMETVQDLIDDISNESIEEIKEEIYVLYKQEVFTKQLYLSQLRKFDGTVLTIISYLSQQEEMHANAMKILLNKINYSIEEEHDLLDQTKKRLTMLDSLVLDIHQEEVAQKEYETAINNSSSEPMKKVLTLLLEQEYEHLRRLNDYVENKKNK
jgi:rubrerythrin